MNSTNTAILLINLGTPDGCDISSVRRYLAEFLMDKHVIDVPYLLRWIIVWLFILPFRPKRSANAYQRIWTEQGSPLMIISQEVQNQLATKTSEPVYLAMRYGRPSIRSILSQIHKQHPSLECIKVLPLYPHYALASTQSVIEKTKKEAQTLSISTPIKFRSSFYNDPLYIKALSLSIKRALKPGVDYLLFSYHGIPIRHLGKVDPTSRHCGTKECCERASIAHATCYKHQVKVTTQLVIEQLGLSANQYGISFQSRLGKDPWIPPFTDELIPQLAKKGVRHLAVVCPAFVSDCLETIEEIGMEARDLFLENGGTEFSLIDCLNSDSDWIDALQSMCEDDQTFQPL
ncbi:MAG: ferrochelatase [Actinobacteria bacterium]|nr:ferrochelatase [Actinomycetota bacterium]